MIYLQLEKSRAILQVKLHRLDLFLKLPFIQKSAKVVIMKHSSSVPGYPIGSFSKVAYSGIFTYIYIIVCCGGVVCVLIIVFFRVSPLHTGALGGYGSGGG